MDWDCLFSIAKLLTICSKTSQPNSSPMMGENCSTIIVDQPRMPEASGHEVKPTWLVPAGILVLIPTYMYFV